MTARAPVSKRKVKPAAKQLGDGLHAATVEMATGASLRLRLPGGDRITAVLGDGVERELVAECMRDGRHVIVTDSSRGPIVIGALQTARVIARDERGNLTLDARDVRLVAERSLVLEAGPVVLKLERAGVLKAEGERMTIDMSTFLRVFAPRVELP